MFLLAILIATLSISGCAGVVGAPASPSASPAPAAAALLTVTPSSISLSNTVGTSVSQSVTAANSGTASLNVSQVSIAGTGFSMSGLTPPLGLSPGQSQKFNVMFDASTAGSVSGTLTIMSSASATPVVVPLHGTGAAAAPLVSSVTISPSTASAIVGSTLPFSATVQGTTSSTAVTWTATRGTITTGGVYTAPATTGADTVTATSVADTTKSASAAITVIAAPSTPVVTSVTISPASASAVTGATVQFSASVQGTVADKTVTWTAALGIITTAGLYTAPASAGTDTVTATSHADATKSAAAPVTVTAPPVVTSVSVSPSPASTITSGTVQFSATVAGTVTNKSVTWKAALGTITTGGLYTAPATASTDTVTATSVADTTKSASSTVTVSVPVVNSVSVSPSTASSITGGTVQFTATVAGTITNKSVTWKAALGTITTAGLYTAPATASTDTVTATSVADTTKSASSTVTVSVPVVNSVTVAPSTASVITSGTVHFSATVAGTVTNKSVTWKAALGTITTGGLYTAPATAGTDTVTATSVADTTKSATATVTVSTPVVNSLTVAPSTASVITSGTVQFSATVAGTVTNKSVTWKAALGTITTAGLYTAPATAGTDTVTATSVADATKSATATVTVSTPVVTSVSVSPSSTSITTSGALQFTATVAGTVTNKSVTWTAALGSISAAGVYTAPSSPGTDTVTATSQADTTKSGTATVTVSAPQNNGALPAFPGAQGGGATAVGGRGGQVYEVTNLNDTGTGSLRDCATASGPRTCVFRVAGVIHPATMMAIHDSDLTIAGQTAPGGGITLAGDAIGIAPIFFITASDVVIRYLTCSIGLGSGHSPGSSSGASCFELASGNNQQNVVLDHLTMRWWDNKPYVMLSNGGFSPITNTVVQWSLMYEPNADHQVGPMTDDTGGFANGDTNDDFHHNMLVNIGHRLPLYNTKSGRWVNNVVYNWVFYALLTQGGVKLDIINNKYVAGNLNVGNNNHEFDFNNSQSTDDPDGSMPGPPSPYVSGNVGPNQSNPAGDQTLMTSQGSEAGDGGGTVPSSWFRSSPMANQTFPINADAEANLDSVVLPIVGNSQMVDCNGNWVNRRDSVDTRIITQYQNNSAGGFFTVADATHSIPPLAAGTPCTESLNDGIPDQWKTAQGLSTTDPNLYNEVAPNGYTYLENYMNGPAGSASLKANAKGWSWAATRPTSGSLAGARSVVPLSGATSSHSARNVDDTAASTRGHF